MAQTNVLPFYQAMSKQQIKSMFERVHRELGWEKEKEDEQVEKERQGNINSER
jgi:hypothetical protein